LFVERVHVVHSTQAVADVGLVEQARRIIDNGSGTIKVWLRDLSVASAEHLKPAEVREVLRLPCVCRLLLLRSWDESNSCQG
jgi:hypothetical protein